MRIEKVTIVDAQRNDGEIVFGPIDVSKSVVLIGDRSKSTWLKAISFALGYSNEMDSLSSTFHNFNGFVEITFRIVKALFSDIDRNQTQERLTLRRTIRENQIDYAIDGAHAERVDVKNLLQSYGFAEYFSFQYAIQCNDLASIEMSNDKDRLQWLKNCCGVDEYYAKKEKSMRVLRETDEHIRKIDHSLKKIDVQLSIFGADEKQQIYHRIVHREKELGHFQRQYRIQAIRTEIERLSLKMKIHSDQITSVKNDIIQCTSNGTEIRRENRSIMEQIHALTINEQQLQRDIDEYERAKAELIEYTSNLQNAIEKGALAKDLIINEKQLYEEKIDETRTRISEIDSQIDVIDEKKEKIEQELNGLERQTDAIALNCQQNQRLGTQFQSVVQRNEYLFGLIKKTKNAISRENRKKNKMFTDLQPEIQRLKNLKAASEKYNEQLSEMNAQEESDSFHRQQEMIHNLENQKFELVELSEKLVEKSHEVKSNLDQVDDELRSRIGESIFEGTKSMKSLMQKTLANAFRKQYFGLVIDNFTFKDPIMAKSLATLMGEYLFYHIVDTRHTAAHILVEFNKANLPGEVNFLVLETIENDENDAHDSISSSFIDTKFQRVFDKIFKEIQLNVKDLQSKSTAEFGSLESVLPDVIEKDGAIIVMNTATTISNDPAELYEKHQTLLDLDEATRYEQSENSYRMDATICSIDETSESLSKRHSTITTIEHIESSLAQINHQIQSYENHIAIVQAEVKNVDNKINELTETKDRYENELKLDLLSQEEKMAIERVQVVINDKKTELLHVNAEIQKLKAKRDNVMQFFDQTLMSRYSAIDESAKEYSNAAIELNHKEQEQLRYAEMKQNAESELSAAHRQIVDLQKQHESKRIAIRDLDQLKLDLHQRQKDLFIELNEMEIVKNNLTRELNQLISIKPPDATKLQNPDIVDMSEADVSSQLDVARHQLKTYQNTNSFDINILEKFKRDRANFVRRRAELAKLGEKISAAMETLDSNINTSIESTFDDLAKHFAAVFERFVPSGSARLHSIKMVKTEPNPNADRNIPSISIITGVEIFAQFPDEIEKPFDDLLGQKRRVVSFAFIVGMQQLCPAPFYLFDCIDELFFEPYLAALISYLNEQSNKVQIIITSNRERSLNGLNFINNIFQTTATEGTPKIQRIPHEEVAE